ncbi:uncharacterized protein [Anabrus simplex]|uniref:uncharacterized protein n=1 Tax=Anabrus simplex TaxID=316456 RepID=UPI0035A2E803
MEEAEQRLHDIFGRAEKLGIPAAEVLRLGATKKLLARRQASRHAVLSFLAGILSVTLALVYQLSLHTHQGFSRAWLAWQHQDLHHQMCTIPMPDTLLKAVRPPEDCSMCRGLGTVEKVAGITSGYFEERYAYTGTPVVVTDAMVNWTAQHVFTFDFFKEVYEQSVEYGSVMLGCQFFPYETEFMDLREALNMSEDRAHLRDGTKPWYIGWSNCDDRVARILRRHYTRPYFLPVNAESKKVDWIFIGSPGYGAPMHVDNVEHPSWQAQLRGRKKWVLEPPPECYYQCERLQVTVNPGEIFVLDTNRWYHQTLIVSDQISITIGAEYD